MSRPSLLVLAASLAAVAVGCAHCDTCDDFPAPCTGPNCGSAYQATFPIDGGMHVEPIIGGPIGMPVGQIPPGAIVSSPPTSAPTVVPPPPTPAQGGTQGGTTPEAPASPPAGMPAPSGRGEAPATGADPLNIPLPGAESPFGGAVPD